MCCTFWALIGTSALLVSNCYYLYNLRNAASTGPAVFKITLLRKNGISAIFFSEMLYWVFFHMKDVVLTLWPEGSPHKSAIA